GFAWSTRILGIILLGLAVPANLWIRARLPMLSAGRRTGRKMQSLWPDISIFPHPCYAVAPLGIFFMEVGIFIPLTFIVSYAAAQGQDATEAYMLLSFLNAGSVVGRFAPSLLADRFGRFNVIIITIALSAATVLGIWLPAGGSRGALVAFAVLF